MKHHGNRTQRWLWAAAVVPLGAVLAQRGGGLFADLGTVGGLLVLAFLILSLSFHEAAHAWVATRCGDTTARDLGRLTVNPIPHIDPVMTILLPAIMMMTTPFIFGGAKPVPVAFQRLRHPWRDMMLVAIAGPASNVLLAIVFHLAWRLMIEVGGDSPDMLRPRVMQSAMFLNLILAIFNMIPVPPLDGSRVMAWLLPESLRPGYVSLERFGLMLVILLLFTGVFQVVFANTYPPLRGFVEYVVSLGGAW